MRICVTGAAGYIGDRVVEYLLENSDAHIIAIDNLMYGGSYMRRHKNLEFVRADVRDGMLIGDYISTCDAVVHLAAIVGDGACAASPRATLEINEGATKRIAEICDSAGVAMIFASTCSVYGANNNILDESSATNPLSLYAGTKLSSEKAVSSIELAPHYIFRLGTLFGLSSEHARLRCDLVANILTYKALNGEKLTVFGGEQWRPLLHVKDAADIMAMAALGDFEEDGTFILSNKNFKIIDVANTIIDVCNLPKDHLEVTDMKFEDLRNYKVDNSKAINAGICTNRSLKDGILDIMKIVKEGRIADVWDIKYHNARFVKGLYDA